VWIVRVKRVRCVSDSRRVNRAIVSALLCLAAAGSASALAGGSSAAARTGGTQSDAKYVVYTRYLENDRLDVWIAHVDGSGKRRLAAGRSPQISPDGRWVVFRGGCDTYGDCRRLYLIASAGGRPRLVARGGSGALWSPDSRFVLFVGASGITRFEVATGQLAPIVRGGVRPKLGLERIARRSRHRLHRCSTRAVFWRRLRHLHREDQREHASTHHPRRLYRLPGLGAPAESPLP
jgi:dipeptidyl aminopeptidase/acylaminoacyl peptidase